jgi:signal transduction histidine kinase
VLLLSARAGEEARIEGMQAGADDYLVKPFSARELLARVDAHLTMAQLRRVSAERERVMRQEAERMRILAEEANQVKAAFLATMSHELRTPLNAIMGYTGLLDAEIAGPLTIGQRQQTGRIETATRHLLQIIEEILTFSRIEAGREEVHLESVDFVPIVVETCKLVEPLATQKALDFSCHTPDRSIGITDPGKLRQILLNLLSNAIKFTDRGEVRLDVSVTRDEITFEIRDTGIGIDAAQQQRVFDPFHQVDRMKAQSFGGTGLGLSVSRELARLLGGDITVESEPGVGSTFTLRLPRVSEPQTLPEPR